MLNRIVNAIIRRLIFKHYKNKEIKREQISEEKIVLANTTPDILSALTQTEINKVKELWSPLIGGVTFCRSKNWVYLSIFMASTLDLYLIIYIFRFCHTESIIINIQ